MIFLKAILLTILCTLVVGLLGFMIPFIIAQFDGNPAWSMITMITVPIGLAIGLLLGIVLSFTWLPN